MPITTTFAFRVRELNRQGMPLEAIALETGVRRRP